MPLLKFTPILYFHPLFSINWIFPLREAKILISTLIKRGLNYESGSWEALTPSLHPEDSPIEYTDKREYHF